MKIENENEKDCKRCCWSSLCGGKGYICKEFQIDFYDDSAANKYIEEQRLKYHEEYLQDIDDDSDIYDERERTDYRNEEDGYIKQDYARVDHLSRGEHKFDKVETNLQANSSEALENFRRIFSEKWR